MTDKNPAIEIARLLIEYQIERNRKQAEAEAQPEPESKPVELDDLFVIVGLDKDPPAHLRRRSRRKR